MSRVEMSDKANQLLQDLVDDHGADDYLLDRLAERLEAIAECPTVATEPAKYPYSSNRLMANFQEDDSVGQRWNFCVTLRRTPDEEGIIVLTVSGCRAPRHLDD